MARTTKPGKGIGTNRPRAPVQPATDAVLRPDVPPGTDAVYRTALANIPPFEFNAAVADVFANMIERSVPGYALVLDMIALLTNRFAQPGTRVYDLGCSLGASTLAMRQQLPPDCTVVAVDNSAAMVERCRRNIERDHSAAPCEVVLADIRDVELGAASIVTMNFTLQFVDDDARPVLLRRICDALVPGGILILAEKVTQEPAARQDAMTELQHHFKRVQGYSDLEIAQKRSALENVLVSNTAGQHLARLEAAGFEAAWEFFRCLNFSAFVAMKSR